MDRYCIAIATQIRFVNSGDTIIHVPSSVGPCRQATHTRKLSRSSTISETRLRFCTSGVNAFVVRHQARLYVRAVRVPHSSIGTAALPMPMPSIKSVGVENPSRCLRNQNGVNFRHFSDTLACRLDTSTLFASSSSFQPWRPAAKKKQ